MIKLKKYTEAQVNELKSQILWQIGIQRDAVKTQLKEEPRFEAMLTGHLDGLADAALITNDIFDQLLNSKN